MDFMSEGSLYRHQKSVHTRTYIYITHTQLETIKKAFSPLNLLQKYDLGNL